MRSFNRLQILLVMLVLPGLPLLLFDWCLTGA